MNISPSRTPYEGTGIALVLFGLLALVIACIWWIAPWFYGVSTANIPPTIALGVMGASFALVLIGYVLTTIKKGKF